VNRLIFINRFFFPDHSATSQILSALAFHLAASGRHVHVIASRQRYDDPGAGLPSEETINGVCVHRVASTQFGRSALTGRGIDYLSFYASVWRLLASLADRNDIIIAKTDPPMVATIAMRVAQRSGAILVNWLQDIYPEVAIELGVPLMNGPVRKGLFHLRDNFLKAAVSNIVVGEAMGRRIVARGVSDHRVHVIHNWADDEQIGPVRHQDNPLRKEWALENKYVVGYSGNLGRAHEFRTVLAAAEQLRSNHEIVFLIVGGGHHGDEFEREVKLRGLDDNFRFVPYQDGALLKYSLGAADVHWISLKPEVEGLIVPSKFYGIAAAGRPIIAITAKDGEIAQLVQQHRCGLVIEPGDAQTLAQELVRLSVDPDRNATMGANARAMLNAHFTRRQALGRWSAILEEIG
jgi:colanic acid biosynthesis glycosyl transferase WcaI